MQFKKIRFILKAARGLFQALPASVTLLPQYTIPVLSLWGIVLLIVLTLVIFTLRR